MKNVWLRIESSDWGLSRLTEDWVVWLRIESSDWGLSRLTEDWVVWLRIESSDAKRLNPWLKQISTPKNFQKIFIVVIELLWNGRHTADIFERPPGYSMPHWPSFNATLCRQQGTINECRFVELVRINHCACLLSLITDIIPSNTSALTVEFIVLFYAGCLSSWLFLDRSWELCEELQLMARARHCPGFNMEYLIWDLHSFPAIHCSKTGLEYLYSTHECAAQTSAGPFNSR